LPEARTETFHLNVDEAAPGGGALTLQAAKPSAASDRFVVDYQPVCSEPGDLYFIMWPCVLKNRGLDYLTPPLAADLHIAGHAVADLWIAATTADADIFVYLEDVAASGASSIVTHGRLRASHRSEQPPPYSNYMGLPWHRGNRADAQPLVPGEPVRLRLDLLPTSYIVKAGHRLRLALAGADPRQRSRNVTFEPAPTITVYRSDRHASRLSLPLLSTPRFVEKSASRTVLAGYSRSASMLDNASNPSAICSRINFSASAARPCTMASVMRR
jgi:putative CocE/NonD family hydrolase